MRAFARRGMKRRSRQMRPRLYRSGLPSRRDRARQSSISIPGRWRRDLLAALAAQMRRRRSRARRGARWAFSTACPAPAGRSGSSADVAAALGLPSCSSSTCQRPGADARGGRQGFRDLRSALDSPASSSTGSARERHRRLCGDAIEALGIPGPRRDAAHATTRSARAPSRPCAGRGNAGARRLGSNAIADLGRGRMSICDGVDWRAARPRAGARANAARCRRSPRPASASRWRATRLFRSSIRISRRAGGRRAPKSCSSRRWPTSRRRRLRRLLAARRLSGTARGPTRRGARFLDGSRSFARRNRSTASAAATWRSAQGLMTPQASPRDGGSARRRDEFREAQTDARLSRGDASPPIIRSARGRGPARPRIPLRDDPSAKARARPSPSARTPMEARPSRPAGAPACQRLVLPRYRDANSAGRLVASPSRTRSAAPRRPFPTPRSAARHDLAPGEEAVELVVHVDPPDAHPESSSLLRVVAPSSHSGS